ncbi:LysR family transcriptional regulator [Photobacterium galatheae]|uniref:HTH lysR-type domain-containing protein n=1 Tax=Photobacterium galatheae TaxID=1654360 RepID=A0A066RLG3_9GAMM|nr:LysR family transcriptional regulator [Photobacterium galatheae]KDM91285.1 hypothetical protein EA58_11980 [Photobacterium galatheae]MCM0150314.1 LysR family transcriptional regulator [Photobacterium galatheae]
MRLEDMELFVKVVQTGSFTRAAELADMPKSTFSRRIRHLEQSLCSRLLERTTRKLVLTEVGEIFYQKCLSILDQVESTQQELIQSQEEIGKLTIYAPDYLVELNIAQVSAFCHQHPNLSVTFNTTCQPLSLMADKRFDLLLDIGTQPDSSFIARPIAEASYDLFAHPDYLARHGTPDSPHELTEHDLIVHELSSQMIAWNANVIRLPSSPKYAANSPYVVRGLTLNAQGIGCMPVAMTATAVQEGNLIRLFHGQFVFRQTIYGIYHSRRFVPNKVKVLIDHIREKLPGRIKALEDQVTAPSLPPAHK